MENNSFSITKTPFFDGKSRFVQIFILLVTVLGGMVFFSVLGVLVAGSMYGFDMEALKTQEYAAYLRIVQGFNSVGTFMIPAFIFSYLSDSNWFSYGKMDKSPGYVMCNIVIVMSLVILPVVLALAEWNGGWSLPESFSRLDNWLRETDKHNNELVRVMTHDPRVSILLLNIFVLAVLPAIGEELLFRGTMQTFLQKWTKSPHWAIWITAFVFSAIHFQISGFVPRMLLGAYLGYLFYWSGSLWLPILAHFMHNSMSILADYTLMRRGVDVDNMNFSDVHGWQYILAVAIVLIVAGVFWLYKLRIKNNSEFKIQNS